MNICLKRKTTSVLDLVRHNKSSKFENRTKKGAYLDQILLTCIKNAPFQKVYPGYGQTIR